MHLTNGFTCDIIRMDLVAGV